RAQAIELVVDEAAATAAGSMSDARWAAAEERARQAARAPFDLEAGPLVRAHVVRVGPQDHVVLVVMHHIVCDGWSMGVLQKELAALYAGYVSGQGAALPALAVQYADFAIWQRQWLDGSERARQLAYWTAQLAGAPAVLELPTDRPRPRAQTFAGA